MKQFELLVRILHHLAKTFKEHAVLKGGMELALFSSSRSTNDLDFVFVPFTSKKEIIKDVELSLKNLGNGTLVKHELTSKYVKFYVNDGTTEVEVEIHVADKVESIPMNTAAVATLFKLQPQIVRVMKPEVALAHKIAAWNERRLIRDVYDIYFWFGIQKVFPDLKVLKQRLKNINSRLPELRKVKSMSLEEVCRSLQEFCSTLTQERVDQEMMGLSEAERLHLPKVIKSQINVLVARILA